MVKLFAFKVDFGSKISVQQQCFTRFMTELKLTSTQFRSSVIRTSLSFVTHVHNASRQHIIGLLQAVRYACSQLGCVTAGVVYGRFGSKIRFENESDGRFDSRFDSNEKNRFAGR